MSARGLAGSVRAGVLAACLLDAARAAGAAIPLQLAAEFQHGGTTGGYTTRVHGVLEADFTVAGPGSASLSLLPRAPGCFAIAAWRSDVTPPATSRPAEVCLTAPGVVATDLDAWMANRGSDDPQLVVPLLPSGSPGGWTSASTLATALFVRGCGTDGFRRLATASAPPGALMVVVSVGPGGDEVVDVSASSLALDVPNQTTWDEVLAGCEGTAAGLPATPSAGTSTLFAATSSQPPDDPSQPHVQIAAVRDAVDDLVAAQRLVATKAKALTRQLDRAGSALRKGDASRTVKQLERFQRKVATYVTQGILAQSDGDGLVSGTVAARDAILLLAAGPPLALVDPGEHCSAPVASCPENPCAYTSWHVDDDYAGALVSDGSAGRPFRSIVEALARAAVLDLCAVELLVAPGAYAGDVDLSRHTRISGNGARTRIAGSVSNLGPFELELIGVLVAPPSGPGVVSDDPCTRTTLRNVFVDEAAGYGVRQRGGSLDARDLTVVGTRSEPDFVSRGTGLYLTCGAEASLDEVLLDDNAAAGLQVAHAGTEVVATELQVSRTGVHPAFIDGCSFGRGVGAVQVHDGARLSVTLFTISNNEGYGLLASFDGEATLAHGTIINTRDVECADGRPRLGFNAATLDGGIADVTSFLFTRPDGAGAVLYENGEMDLRDGEVSRGDVAVSVQWDFDVRRLQDGVVFVDNLLNLDGSALPAPVAVGSIE